MAQAPEQIPETLWIEEEVYRLFTAPLAPWLRAHDLAFEHRSEACARGYIGRWKIATGALWLIDLHGWIDGRLVRVPDLFDGAAEIRADWYSGDIVFEPPPDTVEEGAMARQQRVYIDSGAIRRSRPAPG
ncbi:MAG: hypothetical protein R8L07_01270 [Alphaproteobacteria bacterium]|nr:hypothetical protein [Alphaproteobacteria bacterium]